MRGRLVCFAAALLVACMGCSPPQEASEREDEATRFIRQIGPAFCNYVLDLRRVESLGFAPGQIEQAVDARFKGRLLKKTRQDHLIAFQSQERIPDFDITILAERGGRRFVPVDFGHILLFLEERAPKPSPDRAH
jgi:hypothetical protein